MITAALAAVAAIGWGAADYCGVRASRGASAVYVVFLSQLFGLPVLIIWFVVTANEQGPTIPNIAWGACAGASGLLGGALLYRTLSTYGIVLAAPVTAVAVALVPLLVGLFVQAPPGPVAFLGVCCALASIVLVSRPVSAIGTSVEARALLLGLLAGCALGLQLVFLAQPGPDTGLWPLASARVCSIVCAIPVVLRGRVRSAGQAVPWLLVALAGCLDTAAFAFYMFAMNHGLLGVVGPIVSLYPAATIILAIAFDRERVTTPQAFGLCLGAGALLLVAI